MRISPKDINFTLEDGFENLKKIKKYNKPLFIIHADLDDIIPFSQAELLLLESSSLNKDLFLEFELSKGVFATEVLKEVMKV